MPGFVYLASPYSHNDPAVRDMRYMRIRDIAARLILEKGQPAYSPIAHCHDMCAGGKAPFSYEAWRLQDEAMIEAAHELWVVMMAGWEQSNGVAEERNHALLEMIPVKYLDPDTLEVFESPPLAE